MISSDYYLTKTRHAKLIADPRLHAIMKILKEAMM